MSTSSVKSPSQLAAYEDLFQRLLDCTFLLDAESGIVLEANLVCERILGVPVDKIVGRSIYQWLEPSERSDFEKASRIAMRRYYPRQFESRFLLPEGRLMHVELSVCTLALADERRVMQVIARDITFKRESEARNISLMNELQAANQKLELLSTLDEMTGLYNFRYFKQSLQQEHERAIRLYSPYSIVFCDMDHFKHYNDRNGHPAGDQLLREFARLLRQSCRTTDLPSRYGGEEFAIICPGVDSEGANVLAERIRKAVQAYPFAHAEHQPLGSVSISVGVACYPYDGKSPQEVLKAADQAVYASKHAGRNRVTVASGVLAKGEEKAS
jgi:diguanylate cyclase (GGDEF)-like protein/PAS domain S-box-containing protein